MDSKHVERLKRVTRNSWLAGSTRNAYLGNVFNAAPPHEKWEAVNIAKGVWDQLEAQWARALALLEAVQEIEKDEKKNG